MTPEQFIHYIKNPAHLYQITYTELKSLVLQYPYCQNLRYLLLKKSILDQHPEKDQNLQLAASFSRDRNFLYQQIKDGDSFLSEADSFVLKEEYMELKGLDTLQENENPAPSLMSPPVDPESEVEIPKEVHISDDIPPTEADVPEDTNESTPQSAEDSIDEQHELTSEPPENLTVAAPQQVEELPEQNVSNQELDSEITQDASIQEAVQSPLEDTAELDEDDIIDITDEMPEYDESDLADLEVVIPNAHTDDDNVPVILLEDESDIENKEPIVEKEELDDAAISIEDLIELDSLSPLERMERTAQNTDALAADDKKDGIKNIEFDFEAIDALIEQTKKEVSLEITNDDFEDVTEPPKKKVADSKTSFVSWLKQFQEQDQKESKPKVTNLESSRKKPKKKKKKTVSDKDKKILNQVNKKVKKVKQDKAKSKKKPKQVAQKSIKENANIASETLASLLAKQGNYEKAIRMYEQLSLIFPEKSAFFADQIKQLKKLS